LHCAALAWFSALEIEDLDVDDVNDVKGGRGEFKNALVTGDF